MKVVQCDLTGTVGLSDLEVQEQPSREWLAMQQLHPSRNKNWIRVFPMDGGAMCMQHGRFTVVRDATEADVETLCTGKGFNPAASTVRELFKK